jgi:hypothetical protein
MAILNPVDPKSTVTTGLLARPEKSRGLPCLIEIEDVFA